VLWSAATQHSPDIMIAAPSVEAVNEGRFLAVLGEVHIAINTLQARVFVEQSSDPAAMLAAEASDHHAGRLIGLPAKGSRGVTSRTHPSALLAPKFTYWVMHPDPTNRPGELIPAGALTVGTNESNELTVSHVDGREFRLSEVIGESLSWVAMNAFAPVAATAVSDGVWRRPRVTVDRLVIARESWRFRAGAADWARLRSGPQRFRAARRWRLDWDLPERAFYRIDTEDKPQFVDFTSVVLVDMLGREIRRLTGEGCLTLSEMLPDISETWLADKDGNRYTSEIRMVTVDLT
jgi:hypothetical protein